MSRGSRSLVRKDLRHFDSPTAIPETEERGAPTGSLEKVGLEREAEDDVGAGLGVVEAGAPAVLEIPAADEEQRGLVEAGEAVVEEGVGGDQSQALVAVVAAVGALGFVVFRDVSGIHERVVGIDRA